MAVVMRGLWVADQFEELLILLAGVLRHPYVFDRRLRIVCLHGLQSLPSEFIVATRNASVALRKFLLP